MKKRGQPTGGARDALLRAKAIKPHLVVIDGKAMTTSLAVARDFGRSHESVLDAIAKIKQQGKFKRLEFEPHHYIDKDGQCLLMYRMDKNTFSTFAFLSFQGKAAQATYVAYLCSLDLLEARLTAATSSPETRAEEARGFKQTYDLALLIEQSGLVGRNGLPILPGTTLYQLHADATVERIEAARKLVDWMYSLTGEEQEDASWLH